MSSKLDRRLFLALGLSVPSLARLAAAPPQTGIGRSRFGDYPFRLGVASGDPTPDGGMNPEDARVDWQVADDEGFASVVASGEAAAPAALGHSVHVEVQGLRPHRWYFYRFRAGSEVSPTGRFRTAPAADASPDALRFAFASCQHYETGLYTAYEHMAREDLDLVAHLGDYIYEGAANDRVRAHVGEEIKSLADYRVRHALYKSDPYLQRAHAAFPWIVTWDDHEFDNNYSDRWSEESDVVVDDFLTRRAHAYQAYYENMPIGAATRPQGSAMRLHRRIGYGRLAAFHVLDTRQYRTDQPCGDRTQSPCDGVFDAGATLLGDAQEQWLSDGLSRSEATWDVLAQQIMVGRADRDPEPDSHAWSMDQWSGYDVARKRLVERLAQPDVANPVILTGDIHSNWVNDIQVDFDRENGPVVATEFVGTSITSGGDGSRDVEYREALERDNHFVKFFNRQRGYVSCTVTPQEWKADYQVVEYVSRPGAPRVTRASFVVEQGQPGAKTVQES